MEIKEIIRSVVIGCRSDKIDKAILDELRKIENGEYVPADGWISVEDRLPQLDKTEEKTSEEMMNENFFGQGE